MPRLQNSLLRSPLLRQTLTRRRVPLSLGAASKQLYCSWSGGGALWISITISGLCLVGRLTSPSQPPAGQLSYRTQIGLRLSTPGASVLELTEYAISLFPSAASVASITSSHTEKIAVVGSAFDHATKDSCATLQTLKCIEGFKT